VVITSKVILHMELEMRVQVVAKMFILTNSMVAIVQADLNMDMEIVHTLTLGVDIIAVVAIPVLLAEIAEKVLKVSHHS